MIYLSEFYFPSQNSEANYLAESPRAKMTCYDSFYPFGLFAGRGLKALDLADVTILYGGNGSGKTTALNVMADALRLQRGAQYNRSDFFPDYVSLCQFHTLHAIPAGSLILTSDDVFDYMLDVRAINDNIDTRRGSLFDEYTEARTANSRCTAWRIITGSSRSARHGAIPNLRWRAKLCLPTSAPTPTAKAPF